MKKFAALIVIIFLSNSLFGQYLFIGHRSESFVDAARSRTITCEVYYPADTTANNVAVVSDTASFPVVVFGHGFVMAYSSYFTLRDSLVSRGYIVAFPTTETGFSPSHLDFGKDIAFVAQQIQLSNVNSADLFYQRVAETTCVMGHSMGGGASFLSVPFYSGITAIANLSAAETNPSAIAAASLLSIPALLIAGGNDCITPESTNQIPMYNAITGSCKNLISIVGASHCQMGDYNLNCSFGEATCSPAPTISRAQQLAKVFQYLGPWLDAVLKGSCTAANEFEALRDSDSEITFLQSCSLCTSTSVVENEFASSVLYPNPFFERATITANEFIPELQISIYDVGGRVVKRLKFVNSKVVEIDFSGLVAGTYFVELLNVVKGEKKLVLAIKY